MLETLPPLPRKYRVFDVDVSATTYDEVAAYALNSGAAREGACVAFTSVHGLATASREPEFAKLLNSFEVVAPDGQPVRWALNHFHKAGLESRVYGPIAMWTTCKLAEQRGESIFLWGASPSTVKNLEAKLLEAFPKLKIVGAESPPFRKLTDEEHADIANRVNASGAAVLFVGISTPKQEAFALHHHQSIRATKMCVGAAFDFHAGEKSMAPKWMQDRGLEWLFRLATEPGRLWKRYLINNSTYVYLFAKAKLSKAEARHSAA